MGPEYREMLEDKKMKNTETKRKIDAGGNEENGRISKRVEERKQGRKRKEGTGKRAMQVNSGC